ncbi:hypothetical protein T06_5122 [Trichinella sp. T6]|nr:hypothetical protein T06_5122 [Trichinella sp. T6]
MLFGIFIIKIRSTFDVIGNIFEKAFMKFDEKIIENS